MSVYKGYNESSKKATLKYRKNSIDRITLDVQKGKKEEYRAQATAKGFQSLTAYIIHLIENDK